MRMTRIWRCHDIAQPAPREAGWAGTPRTAMERKQKENKVQQKKFACTEMLLRAIVELRSPWDAVVE